MRATGFANQIAAAQAGKTSRIGSPEPQLILPALVDLHRLRNAFCTALTMQALTQPSLAGAFGASVDVAALIPVSCRMRHRSPWHRCAGAGRTSRCGRRLGHG